MEAVYRNHFTIKESNNSMFYQPSTVTYVRRSGILRMHRRNRYKTYTTGRSTFQKTGSRAVLLPAALILTVVLLGLAAFLFLPAKKAKAQDTRYETRLVSVRVEEGDSLWKIAERYYCSEKESIRDFVAQIKKTNHLEGDTIYPDTYLLIQYSVRTDAER